jgi:thiamine kinase
MGRGPASSARSTRPRRRRATRRGSATRLPDASRHLVDWEYAGWNDPAWDLAYATSEAGWDAAAETRLLAAYGETETFAARVRATRPMVLAVNGLWHRLKGHEAEARDRLDAFQALIDKIEPGRDHRAIPGGNA